MMADTPGTDMPDNTVPVAHSPVTAEGAVIAADALPVGSPKDLFAALMAKAPEETKVIARQLGAALDLNTVASAQADVTGDYKAGDLNK